MLRVADPAPSFALTTSSPPNWMPGRSVSQRNRPIGGGLTVDKGITLLVGELNLWGSQAQKRDDGLSGVSTDDRHGKFCGIGLSSNGSGESRSANNIERGNTKETGGLKYAVLLKNLGRNWDSRVDGVGDYKDESFR